MTRRVLFVDHETRLSGGERDLVDLLRGMPDGAVDAHVAIPGRGALADALEDVGATVHLVHVPEGLRTTSRWELARNPVLPVRLASQTVGAARAIDAVVSDVRPDVVHTNSMKAHVLASPAAKLRRVPIVWHVRDILDRGWLRRAFTGTARFAADRVLVLSEAAREPFEGTAVEPRVTVVYNGIRPREVDSAIVAEIERRVRDGAHGPVIGLVGQIAHWKGQDVLIRAAPEVLAEVPGARFAIVGACLFPENEQRYEAGLGDLLRDLDLDDQVRLLGSIEPIEPVMAALDVLVHASRRPEPFGRVIIEALVQGTPVVTTNRGAGPELVPDHVGRVVQADDPSALATALIDLLTGAGHDDIGAAAEAWARRFDVSRTAETVLGVYDSLLGPDAT